MLYGERDSLIFTKNVKYPIASDKSNERYGFLEIVNNRYKEIAMKSSATPQTGKAGCLWPTFH